MDRVSVTTWVLLLVSMIIFSFFGRFTVKLIRQHQAVSSLMFEFEERENEDKWFWLLGCLLQVSVFGLIVRDRYLGFRGR
jgi:hypothetical protein